MAAGGVLAKSIVLITCVKMGKKKIHIRMKRQLSDRIRDRGCFGDVRSDEYAINGNHIPTQGGLLSHSIRKYKAFMSIY